MPWPAGYASMGGADYSSAYVERGEIYDLVREAKITGFAIVSGDLHSFWAGYAAKALPPKAFEPVGLAFVGASLSSPGAMEANEHNFPKDQPLRALFLADRPDGRSRSGRSTCCCATACARASSTPRPATSPGLTRYPTPRSRRTWSSSTWGPTATAKVRLSGDEMRTEFVCIPRPIKRAESPDGGHAPLSGRPHRVALEAGEKPVLRRQVIEGDPGLSI